MKILILAAVRCSLIFTAVTASLFSVRPAEAYTVTLQQMGANVVANGSGAINLTGLTFFLPGIDFTARIWAGGGVIITGPPGGSGDVDLYTGFTGPTSFGSGFFFFPNTGSGDIVGIDAQGFGGLLAVPPGYVSGAALSDSMTFNNATFASLGVTPGTYVWTWGTGLPNQNFTLHHRRGWRARWRLDSFSARFRLARLGCAAAQIAIAKGEEVMKALPKKLLRLTLFGIAVTSLFSVQPAQAYTVTLEQVGSDVVANGTGAINLTGLTFFSGDFVVPQMNASFGAILTGQVLGGVVTGYTGFTGPTSFGPGGFFFATTGSGDLVGISSGARALYVPEGYVSGAALSDSMTFNNATFASLGVTPGTYVWTWGTGLANQNFTLHIGSVPDGGSTVSLLGCALLGLAALRRKLGC